MFYPKTPFLGNSLLEGEILKVNSAALSQLLEWLCQTPRVTTYRVNRLRTNVDTHKKQLKDVLSKRYGQRAPRIYGLADLPEVLCIAPLEAELVLREPDPTLKEIIVDTSCGAALLRGAHIYAPGVLAMESNTQLQECVNVYADLAGKCKRGTTTRYESSEKVFLGVGKVLMQRYQLYNNKDEAVTGIAVEMQSNVSGVPSLGDLSCADALLQNLPSIVCVRVLDPQPGERILDMCAAPGNKTTHIAELMGDNGCVVALDNSASRVRGMQTKLNSYRSIQAHVYDSTKAVAASSDAACPAAPPFPCDSFDRILLDAPCSGLGNRPQLLCSIKQAKVLQSYPNIQRRLLGQAVQLLRPGGILVYSTCSVTEAECEGIVAWALRKYPELRLVDATPRYGGSGLPLPDLEATQSSLLQRFGPCKDIDTVGFFIAKFQKDSK
ncbi:tRNA (cytosine(72)-C(5))-methyltransferase NSUN6 [Drosophila guanche]|uniref:Blast:Putative methyltransferase NSUN6 n=2 Tax=Drosophila guanche TaxID=7266 RepID=A0A3B0JZ89_DROGU|nr:tRNA (cytosine(72)-C(5))-methyltransferase NSUN6 [Drosophila guanche]SPP87395.1 blast:Putative methyltransferase NSUN6 [Drosophila guanche]